MPEPLNIDVIYTVVNEQANLPRSLRSVQGWARKVFVVDSGSTDRTRELAEEMGAHVVQRDWPGFARQKNWAIDNLPLESDWVLLLDGDEAVMPDLRRELERVGSRDVDEVDEAAFRINRYFIFLGKRIRHCDYYPSWNTRLFKRGKARYEEREVHEHMIVDGPIGYLDGHLEHDDRRGLEHLMAKHNRYSTLEAREIVRQREADAANATIKPRFFGDAAERRRWIKYHIYPRLPAKWLFRFGYMYVLRLGFLDGLAGLRFCLFISAYELLIGLKIKELELAHAEPTPQATSAGEAATR